MRLLIMMAPLLSCAQPQVAAIAAQDSAYARIVGGAVRTGVPGIQAYVKRGDQEWHSAVGVASIEGRRALRLDDRIRVASITKMLTYATVMELVKANRLRREDRVATLLPVGTLAGIPYAQDITVAHLLDHTSGLHNFNGENGADFFRALFADSIVDSYAVPGQSDVGAPSPFIARVAARPDGLVNVSRGLRYYNAWAGAAGAVASTVDDLARFMKAVAINDREVISAQREEFTRLVARPDGSLSWNGGSWGIQASILHSPARDITVIVLSNASNAGADTQTIARKLLAAARQ